MNTMVSIWRLIRFILFVLVLANSHIDIYSSGIYHVESSNYCFSKIDYSKGLSYNHVKAIFQDSQGFMWFGTRNGLNRYDGNSIKYYELQFLQSGSNNINAFCQDTDNTIWIATNDGVFTYNPICDEISKFSIIEDSTESYKVNDVKIDKRGNIWFTLPLYGVYSLNVDTGKLKKHEGIDSSTQSILVDSNGRIWISSYYDGIFLYNEANDIFINYLKDKFQKQMLSSMCDYNNYILIATQSGEIMKFHKTENTLSHLYEIKNINRNIFIRNIYHFDNEIWVCSESGIYVLNEERRTISCIEEENLNPYSLSDNSIYCLYRDVEGGIWVGTYFSGVNYTPGKNEMFNKYMPIIKYPSLIAGKRIREICAVKNDEIWIGTEDNGLFSFDIKKKEFSSINLTENGFHKFNVHALLFDEETVYVGYFNNGMDIVDTKTMISTHINLTDYGLKDNSPYALCKDKDGSIWIGTLNEVAKWDVDRNVMQKIDEIPESFIFDILGDRIGNIWIATMGNGVFLIDAKTKEVKHFRHDSSNPSSISSNLINGVYEDSRGIIWLSTDGGGICAYNHQDKTFRTYDKSNGLPDNVTYKILEDSESNLWFGSNSGLVRFNPTNNYIKIFTKDDGLITNQFNYKSAYKDKNGIFYFGNMSGLISFDPNIIKINTVAPSLVVTDFYVNNKEYRIDKNGKSILSSDGIQLSYNQSNVTMRFSALSYVSPMANQYSYKMEGIDYEWIHTKENQVTYTNLKPGKYVFRLKGYNNSGIDSLNIVSLPIEILPPWWKSNIALVLYTLFFIGILTYLFYRYKKQIDKQNLQRQSLFQVQKQKEIYNERITFLRNIAHEVRTPLTLINGPLENALDLHIKNEELNNNLSIIKGNTERLINLVDQLIDFSRVEVSNIHISIISINIKKLLEETIERFSSHAKREQKILIFESDYDKIVVDVDKDAFIKIISNLINNAIKYSEEKIFVNLSKDAVNMILSVSSDGALIPFDLREKIFEPFFQINTDKSGSGIGLSLCRSLANLHSGSIDVSDKNSLNTFELKLPLRSPLKHSSNILPENDEVELEENISQISTEDPISLSKKKEETILIIEDDREMKSFIENIFQKQYNTISTIAAEEALKILENKNIDLIVCDVMLGGMSGFELCEVLKKDINYSHIPFIILTARTENNSKIKGLEIGADSYIGKPFSVKYLLAQVASLLENRKNMLDYFANNPLSYVQNMGMNKTDEEFMSKLVDIIYENISDDDFNIDKLAQILCMSRSTLHRKIKNTTELTPNEFIRLIRLKKAAEYLYEGRYRVNEVSFLVGFKSSTYFAKAFHKQFGVLPKDFVKT